MNSNELRVVFKAVQDTSVKKVIDNIKGEVNSIGKATSGIFGTGGGSSSFWKLNPGFQQQLNAAQQAAKAAMQAPTMQNVVRNWSLLGKQRPMFPTTPAFMSGGFFDDNRGTIRGLRTPGGGDLAKVHAMGSFEENTKKTSIFEGMASKLLAIGAAVYVVKKGFDELKRAMDVFRQATDKASKVYGKSLTTGLGIGFVQNRQALSEILGVSEEDVVKFSAAIQVLNPRLQWATGILASTNQRLTAASWSFKILTYDISALIAKMANDAAPAIGKLTNLFDYMVKGVARVYDAFKKLADGFANMFTHLDKAILKTLGSGLLQTLLGNQLGTILSKLIPAMFKSIPDAGKAPNPISYMKQLGASSLEHMGLIAGTGGPAQNAAQQTAANTKKIGVTLENMLRTIQRGGKSQMNPFQTQASYQ